MPHRLQRPPPMVRRPAGLDGHPHRRKFRKERPHILPPKIPPQHRPIPRIHGMNGENGLGRINRNACNLFHGRLLVLRRQQTLALDAAGPSTPTEEPAGERLAVQARQLAV